MTLRRKTLMVFLVMLALPAIFISGVVMLGLKIQTISFERKFGVEVGGWELLTSPIRVLTKATEEEYRSMSEVAASDPSKFSELEWLAKNDISLERCYSYLVVTKNGELVYTGFGEQSKELTNIVVAFGETVILGADQGLFLHEPTQGMIRCGRIDYENGDRGCFAIVTDAIPIMERERKNMLALVISIATAVMISACILMIWGHVAFVKPVLVLRDATRKMAKGNLTFKLEREQKDEIGEICSNFEEMRRHLITQIDKKEQYEQDMRDMISNVSHDLKTPLTAIKGYAEGLLEGIADNPEKRDKYIRTIANKANDMTSLVDELSYFAKLDTNKLPYKFETVEANEFFEDCAMKYKVELEMKDFELNYSSEIPDGVMVVIDIEQIRRVLNNLVGNAVKYRNNDIHGIMTIRVTDANDSVRVSVGDNGIGIAKAELPYIFDRFYRSDKARTSGRAGTGIGLAIVKKIVEEHGGRVLARSELGAGTTISFTVKKGVTENGNKNTDS